MTAPARPVLTELQLRVLGWLAEGVTRAEIGQRLHYSTTGATGIVDRLYLKLGARNSAHAVHLAYQAGLLRRERHGDHPGFVAHKRRGEDPKDCPHGCWEGERAYRQRQRALKAAAA